MVTEYDPEAGEARQHKLVKAEAREVFGDLLARGDVVFPVDKAPALHKGIERQIERALALVYMVCAVLIIFAICPE